MQQPNSEKRVIVPGIPWEVCGRVGFYLSKMALNKELDSPTLSNWTVFGH